MPLRPCSEPCQSSSSRFASPCPEAHGWPEDKIAALLAERIERELAIVPAFNEDINTITGQPHGHILYSWNSGYAWLRKMFRQRLQRTSDDPVDTALNRKLGIIRDSKKMLRLSSAQLK